MSDELDDVVESFKEIDRFIIKGAADMRTLQSSISSTNAVLESKGWEIFSRFISGTGLWRIQNRVKASIQLINAAMSAEERRRVKEAKKLKTLAEIGRFQSNVEQMQEKINKVTEVSGKKRIELANQLKNESDIFSAMFMQHGNIETAIEKTTEKMKQQAKEALKLEKTASKAARRRQQGLVQNSLTFKLIKQIKDMSEDLNESLGKGAGDLLAGIEGAFSRTRKLQNLQDSVQSKLKDAGLTEDAKIAIDKRGKPFVKNQKLGQRYKNENIELVKQIEKMREEIEKLTERIEEPTKAQKFRDAITLPLRNIVSYTYEQMKSIVKFTAKFAVFVVKLLAFFLFLVLGLTILKKVFEENRDAFMTGFNALKQTFQFGLGLISSGIADFTSAANEIFTAFQNSDIQGVIVGGVNLIIAALKIVAGIIVATLGAVLVGGYNFLKAVFESNLNKVFDSVTTAGGQIVAAFLKTLGVVFKIAAGIALVAAFLGGGFLVALGALFLYAISYLIDAIIPYADEIATFLGNMKALLITLPIDIGKYIVEKLKEVGDVTKGARDKAGAAFGRFKDRIPGLAEGGRISQGGLAIVGERGPELVQLPRGAQIHSNSASKAMASSITNNITVQVTGRVGANDSEIRDIANKVAREINTRMNRTSTSVVKF